LNDSIFAKQVFSIFSYFSKMSVFYLHAVGEHNTDRHELGEDPQQLRIGEHTVLQTVIQETGVMTQHVVNVGGLKKDK